MACLLDRWRDMLADTPGFRILEDEETPRGYTVAEVDDLSARVLAWLKARGIGREDMVLIRLPHGALPSIAMLGVWKAGAACTAVDEDMPPERVDAIAADCACRAVVDKAAWAEITACTPAPGYAVPDPHDAAYAVYTSGSTGHPKGVLQEYGNLEQCGLSLCLGGESILQAGDRYAAVPPVHFVAFVMIWLFAVVRRVTMCVMPLAVARDPRRIGAYIRGRCITHISLPPSLGSMLTDIPDCLKYLIVSGEAAHGFYKPGPYNVNVYASSESFFMIANFRIDRPYAKTPIGRPEFGGEIHLLAEDDAPAAEGAAGELCFPCPFFRGYINLPRETARAKRGGLFHTGDLARRNPDGVYEVVGRLDDMVKIGGNRIEPAEVEAALRRELNPDWVVVRAKGNPPRLCAYFTGNVAVDDPAALRARLLRSLPEYMVPAFYIHLDEIPLNANGKLDTARLPQPNDAVHAPYTAPQTDTERLLCDAMARALEIERVGMEDDFYALGGDSLRTLEVVCTPGLEVLDASAVFRGRTPRRILECMPAAVQETPADTRGVPLNDMQLYMLERERITPGTTMYNLPCMVLMNAEAERLARAVDAAVRHHPALLSVFEREQDGTPLQVHRPETFKPTEVVDTTEAELEKLCRTLARPFALFGAPLFRSRVFRTEKAVYLFMDFHHAMVDGTSIKIISVTIDRAYRGLPLQPDPGPATMRRRHHEADSPAAHDDLRYFEQRYGCLPQPQLRPQVDRDTTQAHQGLLQQPLPFTAAALDAHCRAHGISRNVFFDTAALLATAAYNRNPRVMLTWTYHGRGSAADCATVGCLLQDCPLAADFSHPMTLDELYRDVRGQVEQGIAHRAYPYTLRRFLPPQDDLACVFYQDDLRQIGGDWSDLYERVLDISPVDGRVQNVLDIEFTVNDNGGLGVLLDYDADRYNEAGMVRFHALLRGVLAVMLEGAPESVQTILKKGA
ncbi:MAG: AMP-binding protein [Akkermansia sp.]|nr:AMP-binding protein [Akkermansia sp.]